jgi:hypothetical protein
MVKWINKILYWRIRGIYNINKEGILREELKVSMTLSI